MHLGELSQVIDAAFGFSGAESHLYMGPGTRGSQREVYTALPGPGERPEGGITVAQVRELTYVYDPNADWNIHLEVLGSSRLDGPTPLLIDALGPDVVEACNGPAMMSRFHAEARRITAGLDPDMDVAPLLLSFLPVMSPERLLQRLSQADQVTVSERISFVAEDLFLDSADSMAEDPRGPRFAAEFEDFLDARPDLRDVLSLDPNPERNPTLIAAMAEFFEGALGDAPVDAAGESDSIGDALAAVIHKVITQPGGHVRLTPSGALPSRVVASLAAELGLGSVLPRQREGTVPGLTTIRRVLTAAGLLEEVDGWLEVTDSGFALAGGSRGVAGLDEALRTGFEKVLGKGRWGAVVKWVAAGHGLISVGPQAVPRDMDSVCTLLRATGIVEEVPGEGLRLTPGGERFIRRALLAHENEV